jgi:hypothetical protein
MFTMHKLSFPWSAPPTSTLRLTMLAVLVALVASALSAALPSSPSSSRVLAALAPQQAEAFQGGWDRDHWWFKATKGEVASGATAAICARYVPFAAKGYVCAPINAAAKALLGGASGIWAEVYPHNACSRWYGCISRPPTWLGGAW